MIKLNTPYIIENGDTVTFEEGKKGSINGTYAEGTLTGTLEGNVLKATFHNTKANAAGLMEITFHESGFDAKWKSGLELGPMRGKWEGKMIGLTQEIAEVDNNLSLYNFCSSFKDDKLMELEEILNELVYKRTINGKKINFELREIIEQVNRTFGELCWHADRESLKNMKSLEHYSTQWGILIESLYNEAESSSEFRTLGDIVHMDYQPFFDGDKAKEFAEMVYYKGIELAQSYDDITWFTSSTLSGEYYSNDELLNAAGKKAIQLVEKPDNYVGICFDENSNLTYNEEIMKEAVEIIKGCTDEIDPELLQWLRDDLSNNGYDDLLEEL